jgi:hypothetical protein
MRITHYRHMTDSEFIKFAETRAESPMEVELLNRLCSKTFGCSTPCCDNEKQMSLDFGESAR